jgi:hypothetical protein
VVTAVIVPSAQSARVAISTANKEL